jgi:hypothetical protein
MQPFIGDVKAWPDCGLAGSLNRDLPIGNAIRTGFIRIFLRQRFPSRQESIQD